jgi:hypothetical protein
MGEVAVALNTSPSVVEHVCRTDPSRIRWIVLCENPMYPPEFFTGHEQWTALASHPLLTPEYVVQHIDKLPLRELCSNGALPLSFWSNRVFDAETIAIHPEMTWEFAKQHNVSVPYLCRSPHLNESDVRQMIQCAERSIEWRALSQHPSLSSSFWWWCAERYPESLDWQQLCRHVADETFWDVYYEKIDWNCIIHNERLPLLFWERHRVHITWRHYNRFKQNPGIMKQVCSIEIRHNLRVK